MRRRVSPRQIDSRALQEPDTNRASEVSRRVGAIRTFQEDALSGWRSLYHEDAKTPRHFPGSVPLSGAPRQTRRTLLCGAVPRKKTAQGLLQAENVSHQGIQLFWRKIGVGLHCHVGFHGLRTRDPLLDVLGTQLLAYSVKRVLLVSLVADGMA